MFCPDCYSDIEDFTQIVCRYLPKKLAAKTSVWVVKDKIGASECVNICFQNIMMRSIKGTVRTMAIMTAARVVAI